MDEPSQSEKNFKVRSRSHIVPLMVGVTTALVCASFLLFVLDSTSRQVSALIADQNAAAMKLWTNAQYFEHHGKPIGAQGAPPGAPPGLENDLVEFSRMNAHIMKVAHHLSPSHIFTSVTLDDIRKVFADIISKTEGISPETIHLFVNPKSLDGNPDSIKDEVINQIELYQGIRVYAEDHAAMDKTFIAAISTYILPCLYALLGAFLYAERARINGKQRDQTQEHNHRYAMALIVGATISIFGSLIHTDVLLSPLAIAFLAGYSIDVFTSRLDALVEKLQFHREQRKPRNGRGPAEAEVATNRVVTDSADGARAKAAA